MKCIAKIIYKIQDGDIVNIDYTEEFTKKHITKGLALVVWCGLNGQPLVLYFSDLEKGIHRLCWESYEHIESVQGHIGLYELIKQQIESEVNERN